MRLRCAATRHLGQALDLAHRFGLNVGRVQSHALQQRRDDAFAILEQGRENVNRLQFRIAMLTGEIVRPLHRLLRLHG